MKKEENHSSEKEHINKIGRRVMIGTAIVVSPIVAFAGRVAYEEGRFLYNYLGGHEQRSTRLDAEVSKKAVLDGCEIKGDITRGEPIEIYCSTSNQVFNGVLPQEGEATVK
jgi:hypothetical protein